MAIFRNYDGGIVLYHLSSGLENQLLCEQTTDKSSSAAMPSPYLVPFRIGPTKAPVNIYPNPSNGMINILRKLEDPAPSTYYLYNEFGREMCSGSLAEQFEGISIDLTDENDGMYFLKVITGNKSFVQRLFLEKK